MEKSLQSEQSCAILSEHVVGMKPIPVIRGGPLADLLDMNALIRGEDEQDEFSTSTQ